MKRILILLVAVLFILHPRSVFAQSPTPLATSASEVKSFDLFWPIAAGKVAGEPLYFLKIWKEDLRGLLITNPFQKIEYTIVLAEKRAVEAERLFTERKDYANAERTLDSLEGRWTQIADALANLEDDNRESLTSRFKSSLEKQRALLQYIQTQLPDGEKIPLDDSLQTLSETMARI